MSCPNRVVSVDAWTEGTWPAYEHRCRLSEIDECPRSRCGQLQLSMENLSTAGTLAGFVLSKDVCFQELATMTELRLEA